jgi:hypothetical protein
MHSETHSETQSETHSETVQRQLRDTLKEETLAILSVRMMRESISMHS